MAIVQAQYALRWKSGLPRDVTSNTWWFESAVAIVDPENIRDMLDDFYLTPIPEGPLTGWSPAFLSSTLVPAGTGTTDREFHRVLKLYDQGDTPPRAPIVTYDDVFQRDIAGDNTIPTQVALVVSFQAPPASGIPQARRRNRVYLGPFNTGATGGASDTSSRPTQNALDMCEAKGQALIDAADASLNWSLVAYSPTYNTAADVTNGWVDNRWDTQRRRGLTASARETFALA